MTRGSHRRNCRKHQKHPEEVKDKREAPALPQEQVRAHLVLVHPYMLALAEPAELALRM